MVHWRHLGHGLLWHLPQLSGPQALAPPGPRPHVRAQGAVGHDGILIISTHYLCNILTVSVKYLCNISMQNIYAIS